MDDVALYSDKVLVMNQSQLYCFDTVDNVFSQAETLHQLGLNIPGVTEILLLMKHNGFDVDTSIYDIDKATDAIVNAIQAGVKA